MITATTKPVNRHTTEIILAEHDLHLFVDQSADVVTAYLRHSNLSFVGTNAVAQLRLMQNFHVFFSGRVFIFNSNNMLCSGLEQCVRFS